MNFRACPSLPYAYLTSLVVKPQLSFRFLMLHSNNAEGYEILKHLHNLPGLTNMVCWNLLFTVSWIHNIKLGTRVWIIFYLFAQGHTVADYILGGFKITADGDCSQEIKTPWKKSYDQPRQHIKKQRRYLTKKRSILFKYQPELAPHHNKNMSPLIKVTSYL